MVFYSINNIFWLLQDTVTQLIPLALPFNNQKIILTYLNTSLVTEEFCWFITKLPIRRLIVVYRSNDQDSYYQFFGACEFELWNHPSLNGRCIALTIWHDWLMLFSVVISREHTECLWGSHLQIPEHLWMDVSYRFIHSLVAAIKGKKRCSWILEV